MAITSFSRRGLDVERIEDLERPADLLADELHRPVRLHEELQRQQEQRGARQADEVVVGVADAAGRVREDLHSAAPVEEVLVYGANVVLEDAVALAAVHDDGVDTTRLPFASLVASG